jgi:serine/threonine-protein kinase
MLGGRYRMIGRLGSGGMGEVYRADDLKLGQPVALKFLPEAVDKDPARLTQLHNEVRITRQVSHPNVCRVYDIDEFEGQTFLSMEYVDGEDLASVLRRVGRIAPDRALALARQLCAGLAAAHDRGVVHKDLKPANIMLDGNGTIRIMDFGLAGAAGETHRAGTPAYMAPEQLATGETTPRSDLYALGLVLYELFTGTRALEGRNLAELIAKREQADIIAPTALVRDLDPMIERVIFRCLERDPARRPSSALAVASALPGGDPLAAALAAGVTLSPDIVAAAGEDRALAPAPALSALTAAILGLILLVSLGDRVLLTGQTPPDGPAPVMVDRAERIRHRLGYRDAAVDRAYGFSVASDELRSFAKLPAADRATAPARTRPSALRFWYRTSPKPLMPVAMAPAADVTDPPPTQAGMIAMTLDAKGNLVEFSAVPPELEPESEANASTSTNANARVASEPDWNAVFEAADLPRERFTPVAPRWTPRNYADTRAAWEGSLPDTPDVRLRLEAASYAGRVSFFTIAGPWTRPAADVRSAPQRWVSALGVLFVVGLFAGAVVFARRNMLSGRSDRRGARRIALGIFAVGCGARLIEGAPLLFSTLSLTQFFNIVAPSWFQAALLWGLYLALEPFVRRYWPDRLISWSRLLTGQFRDPLVGRDVLFGCLLGIALTFAEWAPTMVAMLAGMAPRLPVVPSLGYLDGFGGAFATAVRLGVNGAYNGLALIFGVVLLRVLLRGVWPAAIATVLLFSINSVAAVLRGSGAPLDIVMQFALTAMAVFATIRLGVLATLTGMLLNFVLALAPLTADPGRMFFGASTAVVLCCAALAIYGFTIARGQGGRVPGRIGSVLP